MANNTNVDTKKKQQTSQELDVESQTPVNPMYATAAQKVDNDAAKVNTTPTKPVATTPTSTTPSLVTSAMQKLDDVLIPYASKYQRNIDDTLGALENKKPFSYDLNGDILYHQYADQFGRNADKAMKNTVGQVSALSGGYGNSYAQTAGQQAYADTMSGLNDVIPELYNLALNKYNMEQQDQKDMLSVYQSMENADYGRYRDSVNDAWRQTEYERGVFESDRSFNEGVRQFNENMAMEQKSFEQQQMEFDKTFSLQEKEYLYNTGMSKIALGMRPSKAELLAIGVDEKGADEMIAKYKAQNTPVYSGGGKTSDSGATPAQWENAKGILNEYIADRGVSKGFYAFYQEYDKYGLSEDDVLRLAEIVGYYPEGTGQGYGDRVEVDYKTKYGKQVK